MWDPNNFDNITKMFIPNEKLWNPDIMLAYYNDIPINDDNWMLKVVAKVYNTGEVHASIPFV